MQYQNSLLIDKTAYWSLSSDLSILRKLTNWKNVGRCCRVLFYLQFGIPRHLPLKAVLLLYQFPVNLVKLSITLLTVRLLTHVLCKLTHFFFQLFIATISNSLYISINRVMKDWHDKYHAWAIPARSPYS